MSKRSILFGVCLGLFICSSGVLAEKSTKAAGDYSNPLVKICQEKPDFVGDKCCAGKVLDEFEACCPEGTGNFPGAQKYDTGEEGCCNGVKYSLKDDNGVEQKCCANGTIADKGKCPEDPKCSCSGSNPVNCPSGTTCCNGTPYTEAGMCCNNEWKPGATACPKCSCSGKNPVNCPSETTCCNGTPYTEKGMCCNNEWKPGATACPKCSCVNGKPENCSPDMRCCGDNPYDSTQYDCCQNGSTAEKDPITKMNKCSESTKKCCGKEERVIDILSQNLKCCDDDNCSLETAGWQKKSVVCKPSTKTECTCKNGNPEGECEPDTRCCGTQVWPKDSLQCCKRADGTLERP